MLDITLSKLLGQPDVSAFLRQIVGSGRYGNAYLFHGPAGIGKGTAALAFARAALCERVVQPKRDEPSLFGDAPAPALPVDDACGQCPACLKTATLSHPDLRFLFPVSGEERALDETIGNLLQAMRDDPLHVFQYDKADSIRLSLTRELQRELGYKTYEGARRVVVMRDADRMRADQYSALLKSIEEPGAATVWVLTTSRLGRVPATIRSRCQKVRLSPLSESTIAAFLESRSGENPGNARMLAALSGGSLGRALVLRGSGALAQRDAALAMLEPALRGDPATTWRSAQAAARFGKAGRESLRRTLEFQQLWLRDILRIRYGAGREALVHRDREKALRELAARLDATEIRRRLMVLEEAMRALDGNVSADLTLFSTVMRAGGQRLGEHRWPAHATGRWDY